MPRHRVPMWGTPKFKRKLKEKAARLDTSMIDLTDSLADMLDEPMFDEQLSRRKKKKANLWDL